MQGVDERMVNVHYCYKEWRLPIIPSKQEAAHQNSQKTNSSSADGSNGVRGKGSTASIYGFREEKKEQNPCLLSYDNYGVI